MRLKHIPLNHINFFIHRACFMLLACLYFLACSAPVQNQPVNAPAKFTPPVVINVTAANAPSVTQINSANMPQATAAGNPVVKIDSSHGGAPYFTNYSTPQGLPMSTVYSAAVDKDGNMWFGTQTAGVSRYDGRRFTTYTIAQGLPSNTISVILSDKDGNIWLGSDGGGGLSKYDGKSFTNYSTAQGLADNNIFTLLQDKQGNIWAGTRKGLSMYDGKKFTTYTTAQGLADNFITAIYQDKSGDIWFVCPGKGVSKYNGKSISVMQGIPKLIFNMVQDDAGNLWFASFGSGIVRYDGKNITSYTKANGLVGNDALCITKDRHGNLWIGTDSGASRYDGHNFTNFTPAQGLPGNYVRSITEDNTGNIWMGIDGAGISRYDGDNTVYFGMAQGLGGPMVFSTTRDTAGRIWFTTWGNGVSCYNGKTFARYSRQQGLATGYANMIMADKKGNVWISTEHGVERFDGKTFTNYTLKQGLPNNEQSCMAEDKDGNIWFGSYGISKYDGRSVTLYTMAQGLPSNGALSIVQDKEGNMWFGTDSGVSRFNGKAFTNYTTRQGLAGNYILCSMVDSAGNIWFGTNKGASMFNGTGFTNYGKAQGLPDDNVTSIAESPSKDVIWLGTNAGLCGLPVSPSGIGSPFKIYNENTGYPINDINANTLIVDDQGIVWAAGGDNKVVKFNEKAINKKAAPLTLHIEGVKLNGKPVSWHNLAATPVDSLALLNETVSTFGNALPVQVLDGMRKEHSGVKFDSISPFYSVPLNLVVPYNDRNITIDFGAAEPAKPKQVIYQYMLEGFDKDWNSAGNSTTAVYNNLFEGSYTFKVKALSPYGIWSSTEYKFSVLPPWYRTWPAYILYVALFACAIWSVVYYRSKKLLNDNRLLEQKINERTQQVLEQKEEIAAQRDNLETTLTELKATQSQLVQREKMASLGELTAGVAHEIQNPLNFVNNFSEVSAELVEELNDELAKGDIEEAKAIAADVKQNLEKIQHHGKRADGIVKSMLQHSRTSTGQKELTDINALADEYLRLSYHGLRAKDKGFNATMVTNFGEHLPKLNIVSQDVGRVLLNLFNNAFYAVGQRAKTAGTDYKPIVEVTTAQQNNRAIITVKDNGTGIPDAIREKIMQPFFTTKPTGEGTGLGLSLSYDIVVKGYGGTITVNSKVNEFTAFVVTIPV